MGVIQVPSIVTINKVDKGFYHLLFHLHLDAPTDNKQNRSIEGCSKLKRSVDMTSSGKNVFTKAFIIVPVSDSTSTSLGGSSFLEPNFFSSFVWKKLFINMWMTYSFIKLYMLATEMNSLEHVTFCSFDSKVWLGCTASYFVKIICFFSPLWGPGV